MSTAIDRIEDLRVAWERDLELTFVASKSGARTSQIDPGADDPRARLDEAMAARVHRVAQEAAERLGCTEPFTLYQSPRDKKHVNAQALLNESPFAIRLIGPVASCLDDVALAALIGHEIGHWMALGPRATPPSLVLDAWDRGAPLQICHLGALASELTADRFSLIAAAGELEALVRLDVAVVTRDSPGALGLRELDYLDGLRRKVESSEPELLVEGGGGYPTSAFRLYATWLFWRSDVHRELTGKGPGDLALRDVDATLRALADRALARGQPRENLASRSSGVKASAAVPATTAQSTSTALPSTRLTDLSRSALQAGAALGGQARAAASSAASRLGRFVVGADDATSADPALDEEDDEIDDLELRFRALETKGTLGKPAPKPQIADDLEARFRELEDRERRSR